MFSGQGVQRRRRIHKPNRRPRGLARGFSGFGAEGDSNLTRFVNWTQRAAKKVTGGLTQAKNVATAAGELQSAMKPQTIAEGVPQQKDTILGIPSTWFYVGLGTIAVAGGAALIYKMRKS